MKNIKAQTNKLNKALILLLIFVMILTLGSCEKDSVKASNAIVYEIIEGNGGVVVRDGIEEGLYVGLRLKSGDVIKTDTESKIYIRIDDTKNILLEKESSIEITEHGNGKLVLTLVSGECFFDVTEKLAEGEEMSFYISNSIMSIRGTSGTLKTNEGEGQFTILTGIGYVESKETEDGEVKTINLYPNSKVAFDKESDGFVVGYVTSEDIPDVFKEYVKETEEYATELQEGGWDITEEEIIPPSETEKDITGNELLGYREDENGNWVFSQEDFNMGYGPTYYGAIYNDVYPDMPQLLCQKSKYNGKSQTAPVIGFDSRYMDITNNVHVDADTYLITVTPKGQWSDGSLEPVTVEWTIKKDEISINETSFNFEYTGSAQTFKLTSKYSNTKFKYNVDGKWVVSQPKYTDVGTYEVQVYPEHENCVGEYATIKINITKAKITPVLSSFSVISGDYNYDAKEKLCTLKYGSEIVPKITFKNSEGKTISANISSNVSVITQHSDGRILKTLESFNCDGLCYIVISPNEDKVNNNYEIVPTTIEVNFVSLEKEPI